MLASPSNINIRIPHVGVQQHRGWYGIARDATTSGRDGDFVRAPRPGTLRAGLLQAAWRTALCAWRWRTVGRFCRASKMCLSEIENSKYCVWVVGLMLSKRTVSVISWSQIARQLIESRESICAATSGGRDIAPAQPLGAPTVFPPPPPPVLP